MTMTIEIVMMIMAGVILLAAKVDVYSVIEQSVFKQGLMGVYCVFGLAWAGDTLVENNLAFLQGSAQDIVMAPPWVFALVLFFLSSLILSQAGTLGALAPLGLSLGISAPMMIGIFPSYATVLAGSAFDRTGTTCIGKYVFNHSFMLPGLITCTVSVAIGLGLAGMLL